MEETISAQFAAFIYGLNFGRLSGATVTQRVDHPKGDSKNPMEPDELIAKFHRLAAA